MSGDAALAALAAVEHGNWPDFALLVTAYTSQRLPTGERWLRVVWRADRRVSVFRYNSDGRCIAWGGDALWPGFGELDRAHAHAAETVETTPQQASLFDSFD